MAEMVKRTMEMNQEYIDRLRVTFGVRTEKEAVNKALEMALVDGLQTNLRRELGGVDLPLLRFARRCSFLLVKHSLNYCLKIGDHYTFRGA
ncbi:MAG: hypothetical protein P4L55_20015 [Syntrophobacteraceae bacterium]|nr:hypothetical protein [Syntrophobacteraceae bacterium]